MPNSFFCQLCEEWVEHPETDDIIEGVHYGFDHFRLLHPDIEIGTWPDGDPVIVNKALEPADFDPGPDSDRPRNHAEQGTQDVA